MIVTCPNCEARYAVDPLAIGPSGRLVQCARCDHRWLQKVEGPKPEPDLVIRPPTRGSSLPVPIAPKRKSLAGRRFAVAGVFVALLATTGAGVYVYRDQLIDYRDALIARLPASLRDFLSNAIQPAGPNTRAPASIAASAPTAPTPATAATAPATATAPSAAVPSAATPAPSGAQLDIDLAASKIDLVDGKYVVHGDILNRGGSAGTPTKLIVTYKKGNDVVGSSTYPLTLGAIAPGDRQSFSQTLDNPPPGATDIVPSVE